MTPASYFSTAEFRQRLAALDALMSDDWAEYSLEELERLIGCPWADFASAIPGRRRW